MHQRSKVEERFKWCFAIRGSVRGNFPPHQYIELVLGGQLTGVVLSGLLR
jgi:hypothetical protein